MNYTEVHARRAAKWKSTVSMQTIHSYVHNKTRTIAATVPLEVALTGTHLCWSSSPTINTGIRI